MTKYLALLRGINISGKNKISMTELKAELTNAGFENVVTFLNSGNVVFSSEITDTEILSCKIKELIKNQFNLEIPVLVIPHESLDDILCHAPLWWGTDDKEIYDNLIFLFPSLSFKELFDDLGEPSEGLEQIQSYKNVVFWSFKLKNYQKASWWSKTATSSLAQKITIRTAGTVRKLKGK